MSAQSTVRDVARCANVSIATVSRVINGTCRVSDEVRVRVLSAIAALEYSPNLCASQLSRNYGTRKKRYARDAQTPWHGGTRRPTDLTTELRSAAEIGALQVENERLRNLVKTLGDQITRYKLLKE